MTLYRSSFLACDTVMGRVVTDVLIGHHAFEMWHTKCAPNHITMWHTKCAPNHITMSHYRTLETSSLVALHLKSIWYDTISHSGFFLWINEIFCTLICLLWFAVDVADSVSIMFRNAAFHVLWQVSGYCQYVIAVFHVLWQVSGYCQYVIAAFHVLWQVSGYCQYVIAAFYVLWQVSEYCQYVTAAFHAGDMYPKI
jgi:hypothetical protein